MKRLWTTWAPKMGFIGRLPNRPIKSVAQKSPSPNKVAQKASNRPRRALHTNARPPYRPCTPTMPSQGRGGRTKYLSKRRCYIPGTKLPAPPTSKRQRPAYPASRHSSEASCRNRSTLGNAQLFCVSSIIPVIVHQQLCTDCNSPVPYDGLNDTVFNYNNKLLFSHHFLNSYTTRFSCHTCPFTAFVASQRRDYINMGFDADLFVTVPTFISVWFCFTRLQRWDMKFSCPKCGDRSNMIFCDGTALSIHLSRAGDLRTPGYIDPQLKDKQRDQLAIVAKLMTDARMAKLDRDYVEKLMKEARAALDSLPQSPQSPDKLLKSFYPFLLNAFGNLPGWLESHPERVRIVTRLVKYFSCNESLMSLMPPFVAEIAIKIIVSNPPISENQRRLLWTRSPCCTIYSLNLVFLVVI